MPKLKIYYIKHVVQATRKPDSEVREMYSKLFPAQDIPNTTRKLNRDQYKVLCQAMKGAEAKPKTQKKKPTPAPVSEPVQEKPTPRQAPEPAPEVKPQPMKGFGDFLSEEDYRRFEKDIRAVEEQRQKCDIVLKPIISEINKELNEGSSDLQKGYGGVWHHIYVMMKTRHGIDIRAIADHQYLPQGMVRPPLVYLVVYNRLVDVAISLAKQWLTSIKRKKATFAASKKSHLVKPAPEPGSTRRIGDIITSRP